MTKTIKILLLLLFSSFLAIGTPVVSTFAQTATEEAQADQEATDSSSTSDSINDIKKIIKENIENSKVKGAIDNLLNRKIAILGQVTRITDETITIENIDGTRILPLDDEPEITKDGDQIDVDKVEVENWVLALGNLKEDNFSPRFIEVSTDTLRPKNQMVMIGTISEIGLKQITIIPRSEESEKTLTVSTSTVFQDFDGEEVSLSDFEEDFNVLVTGFVDDEGDVTIATLKSLAALTDE